MNKPSLSEMIPTNVLESASQLSAKLDRPGTNDRISDALNNTVLQGGKKIRPVLTFLMGDFFRVANDELVPYARAIEMVHAATLAHDDVIDEAEVRRERPSLNKLTTNTKAVLAGDYLLAEVMKEMVALGNLRIIAELSQIISDLVEGEWLQIENKSRSNLTREDVERVALCKTGSVLRWCCIVPALLRDHPPEIVELTGRLGETLGVAFQLADDLLDFKREDPARLADLRNGVISAVIYEVLHIQMAQEQEGININDRQSFLYTPDQLDKGMGRVYQRLTNLLDDCRQMIHQLDSLLENEDPDHQRAALKSVMGFIRYLETRI